MISSARTKSDWGMVSPSAYPPLEADAHEQATVRTSPSVTSVTLSVLDSSVDGS
jgi:hypothetical protein